MKSMSTYATTMKQRGSFSVGFLIFLLFHSNQTPAQEIQTAFDSNIPLSQLKSFNFVIQERKSPDGLATNPEMEKLIRENLESQFLAVGMNKSETQPDVLVAFYAKSVVQTRWQTPSYVGTGRSGNAAPEAYQVGTLVVNMVLPKSNRAVWRGVATKPLSSNKEKTAHTVREACEKLAKQFRKDAEKQLKAK